MFYYFYRLLLSSCVCQLLIKFMMMSELEDTGDTNKLFVNINHNNETAAETTRMRSEN